MTWNKFFNEEQSKDYFNILSEAIESEIKTKKIIPPEDWIFHAFQLTPFEKVKVVIIAQDPYPNPDDAMGLAFSVMSHRKVPASLRNIYKEIECDLGIDTSNRNGCLIKWADQGVLLLNRTLTVEAGKSNSHSKFPDKKVNWSVLTDNVVKALNEDDSPKVFILWGANAKQLEPLITNENHLIITGVHPSPLSARNGFFGGKYFSRTNDFLISKKITPIDW